MAIINTYGEVNQFVKSALMGLGATETDPNGRFYLDGNMVHVELARAIAEAIYIQEIFRGGQSVTDKYTTDINAGAIRVMLDTPLPSSSRTIGYGGRKGTEGNSGVINVNPGILPSNDEFMVYLNQVNDQQLLFPQLGKQYLPIDVVAKKIASYSASVAEDRSASTLAEILAYAIFRALNAGGNISQFNLSADTENKYATLLNSLNSIMDNGDMIQGAHTYSTEGRTIIGRPNFTNNMFNRKSGVIMLGGDLSQEMLKAYDLDAKMENRSFVGTGYKGKTMQFHIQSAPDYIWTLAEKYLGLAAGALDNIYGIAISFEATAMGRVIDLEVKTVDATEFRGTKVQPLNTWGHEAFRKSIIIGASSGDTGKTEFDTTYLAGLGFTDSERKYPIAPKMAAENHDYILVPIYDNTGAVVGYSHIAAVPKPHGGNVGGSYTPSVINYNKLNYKYPVGESTYTVPAIGYNFTSKAGASPIDYEVNVSGILPLIPAATKTGLGYNAAVTNIFMANIEIPTYGKTFDITKLKYSRGAAAVAAVEASDVFTYAGKNYLINVMGVYDVGSGVIANYQASAADRNIINIEYDGKALKYKYTYTGASLET